MGDGERGTGKGMLLDSIANDGKCPRKLLFLIGESRLWRDELWRRLVQRSPSQMCWMRAPLIIACSPKLWAYSSNWKGFSYIELSSTLGSNCAGSTSLRLVHHPAIRGAESSGCRSRSCNSLQRRSGALCAAGRADEGCRGERKCAWSRATSWPQRSGGLSQGVRQSCTRSGEGADDT